jgi:type II secretory pathway pseudopilin PulG
MGRRITSFNWRLASLSPQSAVGSRQEHDDRTLVLPPTVNCQLQTDPEQRLLPTADCQLRTGPDADRQRPTAQEGFTLAALLVILTIISIIIAYTVPSQWSLIMRREREKQTIFLMKQFARGIGEWERKHNGLPVTLEQLQKAKSPRLIRGGGDWVLPLNGKEDSWILVPPNAVEAVAGGGALQQGGSGPGGPGLSTGGGQRGVGVGAPPGGQPTTPGKLNPELSPKDYAGPFVAVRPNATGPSLLTLNGADDYSQWVYTLQDLKNERIMLQAALSVPK